jgi:hypothetical protein
MSGVSTENPNEFIKDAGKYILKISYIEEDGYDKNGDQRIKFGFKSSDGKNHSESFSYEGEYAWRFKRFTDAMKAPESFDITNLVGRYIVADMIINQKGYANVKQFEYAVQNDKLDPIKEAVSEAKQLEAEAEDLF